MLKERAEREGDKGGWLVKSTRLVDAEGVVKNEGKVEIEEPADRGSEIMERSNTH